VLDERQEMLNLGSIFGAAANFWREMQRLLLVLWLCGMSTASALLALGLAFLPQVQDLYTEITYYKTPSLQEHINTFEYWFAFYSLCFLWAFTVHYCARTVLSFETWPLSQKDKAAYAYWIEAVPRYLGWVCIFAIFIGQINALKNLQIDNDVLTKSISSTYSGPLIVVLILIIILQTARRKLGKSAVMISAIAILYWLLTAYDIYFETPLTDPYRYQVLHNLALPVFTILWGVLFYYFVANRRSLLRWLAQNFVTPHRFVLQLTRAVSNYFPVQIRPNYNRVSPANGPKFLPFKKRGTFQFEASSQNVRGLMLGLFCLTLIMIFWMVFALSDPGAPPFGLERALLLPVLLVIWVPVLTSVCFLSNQLRFPFLTLFIVIGLSMSVVLGDNHDVELTSAQLPPANGPLAQKRLEKLPLKNAIELWMRHHNCAQTPRSCPPPLLIAASGGASRSAFYVATVLGELHDKPELFWPKNMPVNLRPSTPFDVTKQIFAISSVSGGSLGAAAFASLLRGTRANLFNGDPCNQTVLRKDKLLFSVPEGFEEKNKFNANWKNCLQAITAGDFLSPAMIAFTFRDNLAFSSLIGQVTSTDRALALEQAWSRRVLKLTERSHLKDPLLSFQPSAEQWMPLLLLNGTSVGTGKRLIASPLAASYKPTEKIDFAPYVTSSPERDGGDVSRNNNKLVALFPDSLDLHQLLNMEMAGDESWVQKEQSQHRLADISLGKAVSLSARFPLISPHANLRTLDGTMIDRVVDGGYFDNSGMLSALELARAIEVLSNHALKPVLIQISNHPVTLDLDSPQRLRQSTPKLARFRCPDHSFINRTPAPTDHKFLPELTSVTSALLNARVARGSHAIAQAYQALPERFIHFQVAGIKDEIGANKKLSMSWWLSKSVQNALNNQIYWRRDLPDAQAFQESLNPAFCAIQKFRKAQIRHWKTLNSTPYPVYGGVP